MKSNTTTREYSQYIIRTPSVFARSNLIHLLEIGKVDLKESEHGKNENILSYLFAVVKKGTGFLKYDEISYPLESGSCIFLDCRKPHSCILSENSLNAEFICFYGPNMAGIYEKYQEQGGLPCFLSRDQHAYDEIFNAIYEIMNHKSKQEDMQIYEKLTSLLALLMKDAEGRPKQVQRATHKQDIQKIKEYLDQYYYEKISLDGLAEQFFINKFYLARLFREQFGISVNSYLIQIRISHAKQLLRFTDMSIEQIGANCGIGDANYFTRLFKKVEGISPGEFRKR